MAGRLPTLIEPGSLRGDLQVHTSWTDGRDTLERMVLAAKDAGLEYVAITDHTRDLAMARGLDEIRLREQLAEIRALERRIGGIRVLAGAEVNIRPDGSLDIADEMLEELDFVGAAVHASLEQPRAQMTRRLLRAIAHPRVDALFHPMGRSLGRRRGVDADFDAVIEAARRTGTALEIDAQPERLDLGSELVRKAVQSRVPLLISSDAHGAIELRYAEAFGISVARRGWATAGDVLNTLPLRELSRKLKRAHTRASRWHGP
jgi:DNA polymerase (family 10)